MRMIKKLLALILPMALIVGLFAGFIIPEDGNEDKVRMYCTDGRILVLDAADAEAYENSKDWDTDFDRVTTMMWNTAGDCRVVFLNKTKAYAADGWAEDPAAVSVLMRDKSGKEQEVFLDEESTYKEKGWTTVRSAAKTTSVAQSDTPAIALTFDDGPNPQTTNRLLDILEKNNASATFFVLGNRVDGGQECLKRMKELGMEIGSHTYDHSQLTKLDAAGLNKQISDTNQKIRNIIGEDPTLLRPPYGDYNNAVKSAAGVPIVLWSVDTLDWKSRNADSVCSVVQSQTRDGSILLFHDIYGSTVDAIERLVPALQAKGYRLVTVSELAAMKGKSLDAGTVVTNY